MWHRRLAVLGALLLPVLAPSSTWAETGKKQAIEGTGLPLPRYVSLRSDEANLRAGPGDTYPIRAVYQRRNMPLQIIAEYETWRKVRDAEGEEGWLHQMLLAGKRTALVTVPDAVLRAQAADDAAGVARLAAGVILTLHQCGLDYCKAEADGVKGHVRKRDIWGVDAHEQFR